MNIAPFGLERWFAEHEHDADVMLAESGIRSLNADRFDLDVGTVDYVIPTNGSPEFRSTIADRYGREPGEVLLTCGTQEANFLAFLSILGDEGIAPTGEGFDANPGHAVIVTPTYQALNAIPESIAETTTVRLEPPDWSLDPAAVANAVRSDTRVIVINNPNNPTGRYHSESVMRELYAIATDADAFLLCDEVYRLLADDPYPPVASFGPHGISTTSLTKAYGLAGLRMGWLAGTANLISAAWQWKDYTTISPSIFGQHIGKQVLQQYDEEILDENRSLAARNRATVSRFLDEHDLDWYQPSGVCGFVTIPVEFEDAHEFCLTVVREENVVLAPGELFGDPTRFRIGFGLAGPQLSTGLSRVGRVIDDRK